VVEANAVRLAWSGSGVWRAGWEKDGVALSCLRGVEDRKPALISVDAAALAHTVPAQLVQEVAGLGTVWRLANPWLWDAITTAVLRQVVRAAQARALYRRWCSAHGPKAESPAASFGLVPDPRTVLRLPAQAFSSVGAAFHRTALQAAAAAYLADGMAWERLTAPDLAAALEQIPRIGPWTAKAAAADYTGDFSIYPHGDLAVRTWARRAAPGFAWPETDRAFDAAWRSMAGSAQQLHVLTALTLSWGSHVPERDRSHQPRP
jgi:DNA-3-methyladenine glycosylase II